MKRLFILIGMVALLLMAAVALAVQQYGAAQAAAEQSQVNTAAPYRTAGGCGGGCCGAGGDSASQISLLEKEIYRVYAAKLGDPGITVKVKDYGCHQEAEILKGGVVVKRLSISGGNVTELQS